MNLKRLLKVLNSSCFRFGLSSSSIHGMSEPRHTKKNGMRTHVRKPLARVQSKQRRDAKHPTGLQKATQLAIKQGVAEELNSG